MSKPLWKQTTVSNHRSYKNAKAKMDKLNAEAPKGTTYELMPLDYRVTFRAVSNPMKWRLIRRVDIVETVTTSDTLTDVPTEAPVKADTSGYGEGFCRCGRVFMWGECAGGHKKVDPLAKLDAALNATDAKIADYAASIAELNESNAKSVALLEQIDAAAKFIEYIGEGGATYRLVDADGVPAEYGRTYTVPDGDFILTAEFGTPRADNPLVPVVFAGCVPAWLDVELNDVLIGWRFKRIA